MDAIQLLKKDHKNVKDLLKKIEKTSEKAVKTREKLFSQVKEALKMHEKMEEEIFYPACKKFDETRTLTFEAIEEHSVVDKVIDDLQSSKFNSEEWTGQFTVLKESVNHHIIMEEKTLFPKIRKILDKSKLNRIGDEMEQIKQEGNRWSFML